MAKPPPSAASIFGPPTKKGKQNYATWAASHNISKGLQADLIAAAKNTGLNVYYLTAVIVAESNGQHLGADGKIKVSSAGALGIAQLMPSSFIGPHGVTGGVLPWNPSHKITRADLDNQHTNLLLGAFYLKKLTGTLGYAGAYAGAVGSTSGGYNHGHFDVQKNIFSMIPKGVVLETPTGPPGARNVPGAVNAGSTQWAVRLPNGRVTWKTTFNNFNPDTGQITPSPPNGTIKQWGQPLTKVAFLQASVQIRDDFIAYTGQQPSMGRVAWILGKGWSPTQWRTWMVDQPGFTTSPVWQQNAPDLQDVWHKIYGPETSPDTNELIYGIQHNLGQAAFAEHLRQRGDYKTSNEFQANQAGNTNVFRSIYGEPNPEDKPSIDMATLNGWDQNQYAQYLRKQPQYKSSAEWKGLMYGLADRLGLIQGNQTILNG